MDETVCGVCGKTYDPMLSDAQQRFSFCGAEHEKEWRPGLLDSQKGVLITCPSGLCSLDDEDEGIQVTR
jgi:hypothetical protein